VEILTGASVKRLDRAGERITVAVEHEGKGREIVAASVVDATGRVADLDDLDLDAAGVERDGRGARIDEFLRSTSNPDVYFAGDAIAGSPQLSPVATYEGRIAGRNLTGGPLTAPDYRSIPSVVFTIPALGSVGLTEAKARDEGIDVEVKTNDMRSWRSTRTYAESVAFAKVILERGSRRIVGAHLVGRGAAELVHAFAFAMKHGVTADALRETVFAYPTFHADLPYLV
jgi:glutathione reductase (NADPH)